MPSLSALPLLAALLMTGSADGEFVVRGTVQDATGAVIAGARVSAASPDGRRPEATRTDATGEFELRLAPGRFTVTVAAPGFLESVQALVAVEDGRETRAFTLSLAPFDEGLTVRAAAGYDVGVISSATRTSTPLRDVPQSVSVTPKELIRDQLMLSLGDVTRYTPGIQAHQGENNRDQVVIRGQNSSADFFINGMRDDAQYYRDLYNLERVEALKGPNAMMFGRGGGGGVVNRVTKEAVFQPIREATFSAGERRHFRSAVDLGQPLGEKAAVRLNAMYEDSGSYRDSVNLSRYGINPTFTLAPGSSTNLTVSYERLHDRRVADRGMPSYQGLPADLPVGTYFGNPADSHVRADVDIATIAVEHQAGAATLRNRTHYGVYRRAYRNYVPGTVTADRSLVSLSAYGNATTRDNLFSQTDLVYPVTVGRVKHTLLAGVEVGGQNTDAFRTTGYFGQAATSLRVPLTAPMISTAADFRQSATDADGRAETRVAAAYVQDQAELSSRLQVVGGLRIDRFDLTYRNRRNGETRDRVDSLVSPRMGVILKPATALSLYGSYTVSHLPASGDQFSSLTVVTEGLEPEKFTNGEVGVKWDARPGLTLTSALYRLDRTNTRSTDPGDPTRIVQTGRQRTHGVEVGVLGQVTASWRIAGGYAWQDAYVSSATAAARAGARVPQVPRHTFSLWNHYQIRPRAAAAIGVVHRTDSFAAIDNTVTLPGSTRIDAAAYYTVTPAVRIQANIENALDRKYWLNADGNTNISPGSPRTLRVAINAGF